VEDEIRDKLAQGDIQGREVEYWKVLDRIKIVRVKS
jgi:translation initiation factor 5A